MARFRIGTSAAAPLRIQLGTSSVLAEVTAFIACGDNSSGSASRPVFTRPSTPGSGTGTTICISGIGISSQTAGITSFSVAPSVPAVTTVSMNLPIRIMTRMEKGRGIIIPANSYGLLYADAQGGHTWTGEVEFEEV